MQELWKRTTLSIVIPKRPFCDESKEDECFDLHEVFLKRLREIEKTYGFERTYARFPELLKGYLPK
jgi:hypothetical protein